MRRSNPLRDIALAVTLLTAIPLPTAPAEKAERVRSDAASWFPLVGLAIGIALAVVVRFCGQVLYGLSGVGAGVLLVAVAALTRALHWDAIADTADGWFVSRERRLDVMADSHVGAFGALAIVLVALLQWAGLMESAGSAGTAALVVLAPTFGRLAATFSAWLGKPARPGGLGASVMGRPTVAGFLGAIACLVGAALVAAVLGAEAVPLAVMMTMGLVSALAVPHLVSLRFGGVTGDTMGASVLLVETLVLVGSLTTVGALRLLGVIA